MNYRTLGRTGLRVSEVGFGCGNVGGLMVRGSFQEQLEGVQRALDLGVNYFDTAPSYGDGLSEINLGRVLDHLKPQAWVATKVNLRHSLDDMKGAARRSLEESLKRLGRDSVDVFQLHDGITMQRGGGISGETMGIDDVLGKDGVADALDSPAFGGAHTVHRLHRQRRHRRTYQDGGQRTVRRCAGLLQYAEPERRCFDSFRFLWS